MCGSAASVAFRRQTRAGTARRQLGRVFRLFEECEIAGGGLIERCNPGDAAVKIAAGPWRGAREGGDLAHAEPASPIEEKGLDRKSTRLNSSHLGISYAVFCLKNKQ